MIAQGQYSITVVYDGEDGVGITSSTVYYYQSTSNTELIDGEWKPYTGENLQWIKGYYYWQKTVTIYTDNKTYESTPVCITGEDGADGRGIESITTEFYLSISKTSPEGSNWQKTMPEWETGKYLWIRNKIIYDDSENPEYTEPYCDSSWEAINEISIGARNLIIRSTETIGYCLNEDGSESEIEYYAISDYIKITPNTDYMFTKTSSEVVDTDVGGYFKYAWYGTPVEVENAVAIDEETEETDVETSETETTLEYPFVGFSQHSDNEYKWTSPSDAYYIRICYPIDCLVQFERGNKATDYKPAPEDVEQDYNNKLIELSSTTTAVIEKTQDSILLSVSENYYTKGESDNMIGEISTSLTQTQEEFLMKFTTIDGDITDLTDTTNGKFQEINKYIRFVDGTITLGEEGNPLTLTLSNNRISFNQGTVVQEESTDEDGNIIEEVIDYKEVAYISDNCLYIYDGNFINSLKIGRFAFVPRSNGNLSFTYVGA